MFTYQKCTSGEIRTPNGTGSKPDNCANLYYPQRRLLPYLDSNQDLNLQRVVCYTLHGIGQYFYTTDDRCDWRNRPTYPYFLKTHYPIITNHYLLYRLLWRQSKSNRSKNLARVFRQPWYMCPH